MEFFTAADITFFHQIANHTYHSDQPEDVRKSEEVKKGVWNKTQEWANQIGAIVGDKYKIDFKKIWGQRGWDNGKQVSKFKRYTWARLYKPRDANKDIYYTIGVDGPSQRLIIKLDYQREGKTTLSGQQKKLCEQLLETNEERYWVSISLTDLQEDVNSWKTLIDKTVAILREYNAVYENVISQVWPNEVRLARIVYNTTNWICPSGSYGKSTNLANHEAQFGYGYEEWLLDYGKRINGYHYSFLEPIRTSQNAYAGKTYDIWLYTINSATKERFWVGFIRNVEVLTPKQVQDTWKTYQKNGWLDEMRGHITTIDPNQHDFSDYVGNAIFNIRFKPEEATIYPEPLRVDADSPVMGFQRYTFIQSQNAVLPEVAQEEQFNFKAGEHGSNGEAAPSSYDQQAKTIQLTKQHRSLSHKVYEYLVKTYGPENVGTENRTSYNTAIDIVRQDGEEQYFYELKTYPSLKQCIREAVGQLIEYSYWPTGQQAKKLIIVTALAADAETKAYMSNLRSALNIPIYYQQFDLSRNVLVEEPDDDTEWVD